MRDRINFAWPVTSEHALVYQFFQSEADRLKDALADKRIVIFGAGIRGCCLLHILEQRGYSNIAFCDNNEEKQGHLINQYDILSFPEALRHGQDQVFLIAPEHGESIRRQLTEAGLREQKDWFSFEKSAYDLYVAEYCRPVADHLLVMGDCAFSHIALTDEIADSLGDMLKARLGEDRCKVLAMHGFGQQAYHHIVQSLLDRGERPSMVLLLVVLEVLTPKAHLMPRTQHPALIRKLVEAAPNPRPSFADYARLAEERFNRFQVESFTSFRKSDDDASEKLYMQMNYLFRIREETEGVVFLKKTIRLLNEADIPVVLYVPPVNYMQGERFFGEEFRRKYLDNFDKLFGFLDKEQLKYDIVDASFLLPEEEFAATNTIDETSNYAGRSKLLKFLMDSEPLRSRFA